MFNELIQYYYDYFTSGKNDGWRLIGSSVCVTILSELYKKFMDNKEAEPIENLLIEQKKKYWDIAGRFYSETALRVKATKAAYVLELITINE